MFHRFLVSVVFWLLLITTLAPLVVFFGPDLEERFFPMLSDQVVVVSREGNRVVFTIEVTKNRSCRLVEASYSIVRGIERTPIAVRTLTNAPTTSYPPGRLLLGPFEAVIPGYFSNADKIEGVLYYDCHLGWLTRQIFGPIPLPKKEE